MGENNRCTPEKTEEELRLVYIVWCDAVTITSSIAWNSLEECKEMGADQSWETIEVGFILEETDEYMIIANKRCIHSEVFGGVFKIPKTWIRKIIDLTEHIK